jgi:hypothetical protein
MLDSTPKSITPTELSQPRLNTSASNITQQLHKGDTQNIFKPKQLGSPFTLYVTPPIKIARALALAATIQSNTP